MIQEAVVHIADFLPLRWPGLAAPTLLLPRSVPSTRSAAGKAIAHGFRDSPLRQTVSPHPRFVVSLIAGIGGALLTLRSAQPVSYAYPCRHSLAERVRLRWQVPRMYGRSRIPGRIPSIRVPDSNFFVVRILQDSIAAPEAEVIFYPCSGFHGSCRRHPGGSWRVHTPTWVNRWNRPRISSAGIGSMIPMVI